MIPEQQLVQDEDPKRIAQRIRRMAMAAYAVFAAFLLFFHGFRSLVGLTICSAVTIIAFLWLEEIAELLLQPAPQLRGRRLLWRFLARFALLGVALSVTIFVAHFEALSVLLGFSIVVVGIMGEALYSIVRSFASQV